MAARGISLHLGVNDPDPELFKTLLPLKASEHDARAMRDIAQAQGFETQLLLGCQVTHPAVTAAIADAAARVGEDGIFLLTYAGHGSQLWDEDGDEGDGFDETWCLARGELVDDELYELWGCFPRGARIVVVADSCHSGTVARKGGTVKGRWRPRRPPPGKIMRGGRNTAYPVRRMGAARRKCAPSPVDVGASVILLAAAMDPQTARDGIQNGAYTEALLQEWNGGAFQGSYLKFQGAIYQRLREKRLTQEPCFDRTGVPNPAFEAQRPFTIEPPPEGMSSSG